MSHESGSAALRDLREQIARENDPERLRELVLNSSVLLNMIEDQVAHLEEDRQFPQDHCPPDFSLIPALHLAFANTAATFKTSWPCVISIDRTFRREPHQ